MASAILTENSAVSTTIHPESFGKISEHMAWVQAVQCVSVMLVHLTALIEHCAYNVHKHAVLQNLIIMPHTTKCATPLIALITNHDNRRHHLQHDFTIKTPQALTLISQYKNRPQIIMLHTHTHSGVFLQGDKIKICGSPCIKVLNDTTKL